LEEEQRGELGLITENDNAQVRPRTENGEFLGCNFFVGKTFQVHTYIATKIQVIFGELLWLSRKVIDEPKFAWTRVRTQARSAFLKNKISHFFQFFSAHPDWTSRHLLLKKKEQEQLPGEMPKLENSKGPGFILCRAFPCTVVAYVM
jgi:hypothetical protein